MKFCLKFVTCYLLLVTCYLLFPPSVLSQGEFTSLQDVFYTVSETGKTAVRHEIKLTNLTTNYYVSQYSIVLGFVDVTNVKAFDSQGSIKTEITSEKNGTRIELAFDDQIVGKGSVRAFTVAYGTGEIASKNGRIWEITVPRVKDEASTGSYTATLTVPASFGKPSYVKPVTAAPTQTSSNVFLFDKNDVIQGISVAFGEYQIFDFSLRYSLRNTRLYPIVTEIALPPDTAYQEVLLDQLVPEPLTVYQDADGNWLAKYRLEASQKREIKAKGRAKIYHAPQKTQEMDATKRSAYLKPQKYWDVIDPTIQEKAKTLTTPKQIYDFIVNTLLYDYARIENKLPRAGSATVLASPDSAICMEFTDLFIALARAADIPAREIDGFASTQNTRLRPLSLVKDVLHAWPEYYDDEKKMWISVDPTWGNTGGVDYFDTFDFNHFAFVIKGSDSEYPSPAGSYKEELEQKDVEVTTTIEELFEEMRNLTITIDVAQQVFAGFPIRGTIIVENNGNKLISEKHVLLRSSILMPNEQLLPINPLPPFGKLTIPFTLKSSSYFDNVAEVLTASMANKTITKNLHVVPIFLVYLPILGGGIGAGILFFLARKAWHLHIQRSSRQSSLRGKGQQTAKPRLKLPSQKGRA